ncbi:hypothetical protein B0H17DRAFT_991759, partial [Mycena rosella]
MLRTGQSLLAMALQRFLDAPAAPFRVHRTALAGKDVGMWFGPSVTAAAMRWVILVPFSSILVPSSSFHPGVFFPVFPSLLDFGTVFNTMISFRFHLRLDIYIIATSFSAPFLVVTRCPAALLPSRSSSRPSPSLAVTSSRRAVQRPGAHTARDRCVRAVRGVEGRACYQGAWIVVRAHCRRARRDTRPAAAALACWERHGCCASPKSVVLR